MGFLFLSIGIWVTAVYSLRVAFQGNPMFNYLLNTDTEILKQAEQAVELEDRMPSTEKEIQFLQKFSRIGITEMIIMFLEVGILIFFVITGKAFWLSCPLLAKDLTMIGISIEFSRRYHQSSPGLFTSIRELPRWVMRLDRLSSLVSAAGFILLFLHLNGLINL